MTEVSGRALLGLLAFAKDGRLDDRDDEGMVVNDDAHETTCTSRGDAHHEFQCTWRER